MIGLARTGRVCAHCREYESAELGPLTPYHPGTRWVLLCAGCARSYPISPWRRLYSAIVRWWRMRIRPLLTQGETR